MKLRWLCLVLAALMLAGCGTPPQFMSQPPQPPRRTEASPARRIRATTQELDRLKAAFYACLRAGGDSECEAVESRMRRTEAALVEAQQRIMERLTEAGRTCVQAGGTYDVCYADVDAYLACVEANGLGAVCSSGRR